jgi:hypothetical protein
MSYINWYPLESRQQDGLTIVVDKTYEDMDPADSFDESCFDIQEIREDIDAGRLDWFILRVRVFLDDVELGRNIVGGMLYKDAEEVLTDGVVDDMLAEAMHEARSRAIKLKSQLEELGI